MATGHALVGPSSAHRWLKCPGSVLANADKPWEQNAYALEGTSAHALLETAMRLDCAPEEFLGQVLEAGHVPVDEEMADAVGYAIDFVSGYMSTNPKATLHIETPVYPAKLLGTRQSVIWGTPDIQISTPGAELVTIDYKHGIGIPVGVKDNPQIRLYHAGKRVEHGPYRRYRSVVIQPRIPRRKPIQEAVLTDKELMHWIEKEVRPVIPILLKEDAPRLAGDWCRYCFASGNCPAQMKQVFEKAAKEFGKVSASPKALAPAELAKYLNMLPAVEEAMTSFKAVAIKAVHAGVKVPGWEQDWTHARRKWADDDKATALLEKLGLEKKERYSIELVSPRAAEDLLRKKGKLARPKRGEKRPASPLEPVVVYGEQNPTIRRTPA